MDGILSNLTYGVDKKALFTRTLFVWVVAFFSSWIVVNNWRWYEDELEKENIALSWHSPNANAFLWVVWWLTLGLLWGYHLRMHPRKDSVNILYPTLVVLTLTWQVALFEKRATSTAKWVALISLFVLAYLMYDSYYQGNALVTFVSIAHLLILLITVMQIWHIDVKMSYVNDDTDDGIEMKTITDSEYQHPWKVNDDSCSEQKWW